MKFSNTAILNTRIGDYCCIISEAINLMQNVDLITKKAEHYKTYHLLSHIKMGKEMLSLVILK